MNANLFDTAACIIFDWHFCMLLRNMIVECISSEELYIAELKATCHVSPKILHGFFNSWFVFIHCIL